MHLGGMCLGLDFRRPSALRVRRFGRTEIRQRSNLCVSHASLYGRSEVPHMSVAMAYTPLRMRECLALVSGLGMYPASRASTVAMVMPLA